MDARRIRRRALIRFGTAAWLCCAAFSLPVTAAAPPERFFDYLYIEASSGSSAGGHAAVRFDDEVYHFQHSEPGIIRAAVQSWPSFDLSYRGLGNRPIHIQRVGLSSVAYDRLRDVFQQRYLVQESHVRMLESVLRERELLECLAANDPSEREGQRCGVALPGAGYFFATGDVPESANERRHVEPLTALQRDIEQRYGTGFLAQRRRLLQDRIDGLRPKIDEVELPRAGRFATSPPRLADEYSELLLEWLALRVLAGDAAPVSRAFRRLPGSLTAAERRSLAVREEQQRRVIIDLFSSSRDDRGYPLLVAMARLVALHASIAADHLVVLDTYGDDEAPLPPAWTDEHRTTLQQIRDDRRRQLEKARRNATAAPADDEAAWSRLELSANIALELDGALDKRRALRWQQPTLVPARGATLRVQWPAPRMGPAVARAAAAAAIAAQARLEDRLRELYRYDLLQRNCVTEIFRTIDTAGGAQADLGGRITFGANVAFIPFVSADAVRDEYAVTEAQVLPSYRQQGMKRLRDSPSPWTAVLREETALTSTLVPFDPDDEVFLFFSEDSVALRPLAGIANVVFSAAGILGGAVASPFDRGELFTASVRGMFYSFPEIAFVNIRKGTVPLLPSTWDAEASGPEALRQ